MAVRGTVKRCESGCTVDYAACGGGDCVTDITCRKKEGDDSIGPPDEDGKYSNNGACRPQGGYTFSGTVPWSFWTVDVTINWTYSGGQWHFSGSVSRGTVPSFIYPDDPEIFGNSSKVNDLDAEPCSQCVNGATVFFGSVYQGVVGTGVGGFAPGPLVDTAEEALNPLLGAIADDGNPWDEDVDCDMNSTAPDGATGDFSYLITQPKAALTGLIDGDDYILTFHYQKYVGGEWVAIYDLEFLFTADGEEDETPYVSTNDLFQFMPGQIRLDPDCPASLVNDS